MKRDKHGNERGRHKSLPPPIRSFVGRAFELARVEKMFDRETLFLIYGIAGIGKTEFAYRFVDRVRHQGSWCGATPLVYTVRAHTRQEDFLASLRVASGVDRAQRIVRRRPLDPRDDLEVIVDAWNERPFIVLLDDLHAMDAAVAGRLLGHFARHVRASRVIVTSRIEIPIDLAASPPVVTRLAPLDVATSTALAAELTARLGVCVDDLSDVVRRAGGSPFYLQHEVAALATPNHERADVLAASLDELDEASRRLLLRLAMVENSVSVDELSTLSSLLPCEHNAAHVIEVLSERFLLDRTRGALSVHPLVRDVVVRMAPAAELSAARREAAALHLRRFEQGGVKAALDAVHAVSLLVSGGARLEAVALAERAYRQVSMAALDHLLLPLLETARSAIQQQAHPVDLLMARTYARRSLLDQARQALRRASADPELKRSRRYLMVAGSVQQRLGHLVNAERYFVRAELASEDARSRLRAALQVADVQSLRGQGAAARATLNRFSSALQIEEAGHEMFHWGWCYTLSLALEQRFHDARVALREIERHGEQLPDDESRTVVEMLGVIICAELDDVSGARERILALHARAGSDGLRKHMVSTYRGVLAWAKGDLGEACALLGEAHQYFSAHEDEIWRAIAGYYLGRALLASGWADRAVDAFEDSLHTAKLRGLEGLLPIGRAALARARISLGQVAEARALVEPLVCQNALNDRARASALRVRAAISAVGRNLPAMRRDIREALQLGEDDEASRYETLVDLADLEILAGGAVNAVISAAEAAADYYRVRCRAYMEARACMALATGYASLAVAGEEPERRARAALAIVDRAVATHGLEHLAARAAVVHRFLSSTTHDPTPRTPLMEAIAAAGPRSKQAGRSLGFLEVVRASAFAAAVGQDDGVRSIPVAMEAERHHDLLLDLDSGMLTTLRGARRCGPVAVGLLATLIRAQGEIVPAESLFRSAWQMNAYHPLRHRNALYVAISRLRRLLRELIGRDVIDTQPSGWRLVRDLDACVVDNRPRPA